MSEVLVGVSVTVIADGIRDGKCRISVRVVPDPKARDPRIDLQQWPSQIAEYARCIQLLVGELGVDALTQKLIVNGAAVVGTFRSDLSCRDDSDTLAKQATALWQSVFTAGATNLEDGCRKLAEAIANEGTNSGVADADAEPEPIDYSEAEMGAAVTALSSSAAAHALNHRLQVRAIRATDSARSQARTSANHVTLEPSATAGRPAPGAWRMLRDSWFQPAPIDPGVRAAMDDARRALSPTARRTAMLNDIDDRASYIRAAAEYFRNLASKADVWATGNETEDAGRASIAFRQEMDRFKLVWGIGRKRRTVREKDAEDDDKKNAPLRKLASILSYPTLAKFFSLIVDFEVPVAVLDGRLRKGDRTRQYGLIAVALPRATDCTAECPAPPADVQAVDYIWSAIALDASGDARARYFGPCTDTEIRALSPQDTDEIRDGLLNLGLTVSANSTTARFVLQAEDVTNALFGFDQTSTDVSEGEAKGALQEDQSLRPLARRTTGITMTDACTVPNHERPKLPDLGDTAILFANDLLEGVRIDVATLRLGSNDTWTDADRWRSLMGRELSFPGTPNVPEAFLKAVSHLKERDDGRARSAKGVSKYKAGARDDQTETVVHHDRRVFTWSGESLGTPSMQHEQPVNVVDLGQQRVCVDPCLDLGINIAFAVPRGTQEGTLRCPPPLREHTNYMVGARACWMNGCGPSLDDARHSYRRFKPSIVLGKDSDHPFTFCRHGEVDAPEILLPQDDRLVTTRRPEHDTPGEALDVMVIRTGGSTTIARRMLMPGRTTLDGAEQAGVFDGSYAGRPPASFTGRIRFRADPDDGTYPVAVDGTWKWPPRPTFREDGSALPPPEGAQARRSRGSVLVLDGRAALSTVPYFADPMAGELCARFVRGENVADLSFGVLKETVRFWPQDGHSPDAVPILLELQRVGRDAPERGALRITHANVPELSGTLVRIPKLIVSLQPGEDIELELWAPPRLTHDECSHVTIADALDGLVRIRESLRSSWSDRSALTPAAVQYEKELDILTAGSAADSSGRRRSDAWRPTFEEVLCESPIPQLSSRRRVRLVHAIDRPYSAPRFRDVADGSITKPAIHAVVITVAPELVSAGAADPAATDVAAASVIAENGLPASLKSWTQYVRERGTTPFLHWPSVANGSTAFFVGEVDIDRRTTGRLRVHALWFEFEPSGLVRDKATDRWSFRRRAAPPVQIFAIERIAATDDLIAQGLDLTKDDAVAERPLRGLAYSFPDAKARRLSVGMVVTSRFTDCFPPDTSHAADSVGGVGRYERASVSDVTVWVDATARPNAPIIDRVIPVFRWTTTGDFASDTLTWKREAQNRAYFSRADRFSSGEGERLALVFGPSGNGTLCGFEAVVQDFGQYVTRWGTDPIHASAGLPPLIPPTAFRGGKLIDRTFLLPFVDEAEVTSHVAACADGDTLSAQQTVVIRGRNFVKGATAFINDVEAISTSVNDDGASARAVTRVAALCPLKVTMKNPALDVTIKTFEPTLDEVDGRWYCDFDLNSENAYFPFIQFGLANYQEHAVEGLQLSKPIAVMAQVPPQREGSVTFHENRKIVMEHHGIGYGDGSANADVPVLNVRLLRASHPGRVPQNADGTPTWTPVTDHNGSPVEHLRVRPIVKGAEVWWCEEFKLPTLRAGVRYGLLIEEVELMQADPDADECPKNWQIKDGKLYVTTVLEERGPLFGHIVDLGE
jgi:hypothetical protein